MRNLFCGLMIVCMTAAALAVGDDRAHAQDTGCIGALSARLIPEREGQVTPGAPLRLRHGPSHSSDILAEIPGGSLVMVRQGPVCRDGLNWWEIDWQGVDGWAAEGVTEEYYLAPLSSPITVVELGKDQHSVTATIGNMQFEYDGVLGSRLEIDEVYPINDPTLLYGSSLSLHPGTGYHRIRFISDTDKRDGRSSYDELLIFSVEELISTNSEVQIVLSQLQQILINRPAVLPSIPVLPIQTDMQQLLTAKVQYLQSSGITGVRVLTYYSPYAEPILSSGLRYYFMGLSYDSRWLIAAKLGVRTPLLAADYASDKAFPNPADPSFASLLGQYISDTAAKLDKASASDFTPPLAEIDAILESLVIDY